MVPAHPPTSPPGPPDALPRDRAIRRAITTTLPDSFFAPRPQRLVYLALANGALIAHLWVAHAWRAGRVSGVVYGLTLAAATGTFPAFMFVLHELEHGAIVRGRRLRTWLGFASGFWMLFQPEFWRRIHQHHHTYPNHPTDTHRLRSYDRPDHGARFVDYRLGNPVGVLSAVFAIHFLYAFCLTYFVAGWVSYPMSRRRAVAEFVLHAAALAAVLWWAGRAAVLYGYLPVFVAGSALVNMYMVTQHFTRPMSDRPDALRTATSVYVFRPGLSYMGFGRHVEHHLFPSVSHGQLAVVSRYLAAHHPREFECLPIHRAISKLFRLPGYYYAPDVLTDRKGTLRVSIR